MAIKVIVELLAKPGKRAELKNLLENVAVTPGPREPDFLFSTRYEVLDNPDILVEIADWESAEVRAAAMQKAMSGGAYSGGVVSRAIQGDSHPSPALIHSHIQ